MSKVQFQSHHAWNLRCPQRLARLQETPDRATSREESSNNSMTTRVVLPPPNPAIPTVNQASSPLTLRIVTPSQQAPPALNTKDWPALPRSTAHLPPATAPIRN